jgi:transposase
VNDIDPGARRRRERARQEGIWRYLTIQDAADPALTGRQRGAVVRRIVAETATDGFGNPRRVSRPTVERWLRAYRAGGLAALTPAPRQVTPRTDPQVLEQAAALKAQLPARTAEQVRRVLLTTAGWSPSAKTLQRHFRRLELAGPRGAPAAFGAFEAARPNDLWTGDTLCLRRHKPSRGYSLERSWPPRPQYLVERHRTIHEMLWSLRLTEYARAVLCGPRFYADNRWGMLMSRYWPGHKSA